MHPGQDDRPGEEAGGGCDEVLAFVDQVAGDLRAPVGGLTVAVEVGVVVGAELHLGAPGEQHLFRLARHERAEAGGQPGDGDPQEGAGSGGTGQQEDGRPRFEEPVVDVTAGEQRGEGAADGDQAEGLEHSGGGLAEQEAGGRPPVHPPGEGQRAAHQLGRRLAMSRIRMERPAASRLPVRSTYRICGSSAAPGPPVGGAGGTEGVS